MISFVGVSANTGLTRAFRHRPFMWLWFGQTVSSFGDSIHRLALVWWVMQKTGSGLAMGTVIICSTIPMIPFLLIGGALVDRIGAVRLMLASDVGRTVMTALLAYLVYTDQLEVWHVYVFAAVFGFASAFFGPASAALKPLIVPKDDLPSANSLSALSSQAASIVGPMLAAAILSFGQSSLAFALDASTFAISALSLLPLRGLTPKASGEGGSVIADVRDGMGYVRREPWLWISILAFMVINPATGPVLVIVLPYIITQVNHQGASVLAIVEGAAATGTIFAAFWLGRRPPLAKRGLAVYTWVIVSGLGCIAFGFLRSTYALAGLAAVVGFSLAALVMVWNNLMQDRVPPDKLGRVYSIDIMGAIVTQPIGMAVVGWGIDRFSPWAICTIAGGLTIVSAGLSMLHPQIREID
ncbi:MAG: MFS transporter [Kofleriaceae bacterium]|nr:MFS transporter [Kofleriaceae bacterium]